MGERLLYPRWERRVRDERIVYREDSKRAEAPSGLEPLYEALQASA